MTASAQRESTRRIGFNIESPLAIELRRIMIRLNRELDLDRKRCLLVTSSERGEGKSLFALNFALILASHMQKRILLVDGDLRRPVQHTAFGVDYAPGLGEFLAGAERPTVHATTVPNLDFLAAGHCDEDPSRLLSPGRVRAAFDALKNVYDIIVLDSPPVVPVSDPLQYIDVVDGALFMVMAGRTPREVVQRGVGVLRSVGANILGVVANNLGEVLPYYYDRKYYGYASGRPRG